jgi:hypothetical protein
MPRRNILCLANSRKHGGRCVAGLAEDGADWVRAVSPSEDGTLFPNDYQFADGGEPVPLDLVDIALQGPRPRRHHPEDWQIEPQRWRRLPRLGDHDLASLLRPHVEAGPSLIRGVGDRISFASIEEEPMVKSLALAMPDSVELYRRKTLRGTAWFKSAFFWVANGV